MVSEDFLSKLEDALLEKVQKADLQDLARFVIEEGLYIALMSDLFLVSGRMRIYEDDGMTMRPLAVQRLVIAEMVHNLANMSQVSIPFTQLRPLEWATPVLRSWETELYAGEIVDGLNYHTALPAHMRMFMVLGLPGMLRIAVQLTRQLIQLAG